MTKNTQNIQEPSMSAVMSKNQSIFQHPLFDLPFRGYFLLAPSFTIISLSIWLAFLNGAFTFNVSGLTSVVWHIHEMIFAFAATIAVAFILTAVQTWTGKRSLHGPQLGLLIILWLAIRIALYINNEYSLYSAILLQAIWWATVIAIYTKLVVATQNRRNYLFIPIFLIMAVFNLTTLIADLSGNTAIALHLSRSMILVFVLLMAIVGGRVIPFFTVRGTNAAVISTPKWLTFLLIAISIIGLAVFVIGYFVPLPIQPSVFMIIASVLHFIRLSYWHSLQTISVPLLWSLHAAYGFISLGLLMLGLSYYQVGISFSDALHLITIGAISLMILSMMSRVSLGHTGRALVVKKIIVFAFILMVLATFIRSISSYFITVAFPALRDVINSPVLLSLNVSAGLWILAMLIFIIIYWPILTTAKK